MDQIFSFVHTNRKNYGESQVSTNRLPDHLRSKSFDDLEAI